MSRPARLVRPVALVSLTARLRLTALAALVVGTALTSPALAAPPLPPLPGQGGPAAPNPGQAASPAQGGATNASPNAPNASNNGLAGTDVQRKGVVQVEQAGRPIAIGAVLGADGRVLTSLSALGSVETPDIRYADGTVVKTKIGHKDKGWDLALLIPQTGKWLDGFVPSAVDPQGVELKSYLPKAGKLGATPVGLKGRIDARSTDGEALPSVLDVDLKGNATVPGAPVIDPDGKVVGILVRACRAKDDDDAKRAKPKPAGQAGQPENPAKACSAITVGAPVYALRGFLKKTPANAVQPAPWLGLGGAPTEAGNVHGVRVMGIAPGSPAEKAGLTATGDAPDTIVAVDGQPVESPEQLAEVIAKRAIGQQVKLLAFSAGKFREVAVTLRPAP